MTKLGDIFKKQSEKQSFSSAEKHWGDLESMLNKKDESIAKGKIRNYRKISIGLVAILTLLGLVALFNSPVAEVNLNENIAKKNKVSTKENKTKKLVIPTSENTDFTQKATPLLTITNNLLDSKAEVARNTIENVVNHHRSVVTDKNNTLTRVEKNNELTIFENKEGRTELSIKTKEKSGTNNRIETKKTEDRLSNLEKTNLYPTNTIITVKEEIIGNNTDEKDVKIPSKEGENAVVIEQENTIAYNDVVADKTEKVIWNNVVRKINDNSQIVENELFKDVLSFMTLLEINTFQKDRTTIQSVQEDFIEGEKSRLQLELGIYGGAMYVDKYLKSTLEQPYIQRRLEEEKGRMSFNTGMDVNLKYGKFLLTSGVNYHQQGEITNYANEYKAWEVSDVINYAITDNSYWQVNTNSFTIITDNNYTTTVDSVFTYYDENIGAYVTDTVSYQTYVTNNLGVQQFNIVDSVYVQQLDSVKNVTQDSVLTLVADANNSQQKTTTRFAYVEVPIMIGVEIPVNRLSLSLKTGIGIGMLTRYEVNYLLQNYSAPQLLRKSQTNQLMLNYLLRIGVKYAVTEKIAISCNPFYRLNISNVLNSKDVTQKYWNAGVNVGIVCGLNSVF